jgi:hypothetical protein
VPHFVQGICGNPFQSPFAKPPGKGESSPLSNALWGFANLLAGALLLHYFRPRGCAAWAGWGAVGLGVLLMAMQLSVVFGKVRSGRLR